MEDYENGDTPEELKKKVEEELNSPEVRREMRKVRFWRIVRSHLDILLVYAYLLTSTVLSLTLGNESKIMFGVACASLLFALIYVAEAIFNKRYKADTKRTFAFAAILAVIGIVLFAVVLSQR